MSKNITIQEGGVGKTLSSIKKIETSKQGGGSVTWIPEDEANLKTKSISKNGTYKAEDSNAYGFSEVYVNVRDGGASGVKPGSGTPPEQGGNGNDNEYHVETNSNTGELEETVLPSSIKIVGNPTKTTYEEGESINKAGMVVKAYKNDGTLYDYSGYQAGAIPLSELEIEPTKAHADSSSGEYTDGHGVNAVSVNYIYENGIYLSDKIVGTGKNGKPMRLGGGSGVCTLLLTRYDNKIYAKRISGSNNYFNYYTQGDNGWIYSGGTTVRTQTEVFARAAWEGFINIAPTSTSDPTHAREMKPIGQKVTVKWKRPKDEKELTDTFEITVNSANETNESNEGNNTGGGGSW